MAFHSIEIAACFKVNYLQRRLLQFSFITIINKTPITRAVIPAVGSSLFSFYGGQETDEPNFTVLRNTENLAS